MPRFPNRRTAPRNVIVVAGSLRALNIRLARLFSYDPAVETFTALVPDKAVPGGTRHVIATHVRPADCRAMARILRSRSDAR